MSTTSNIQQTATQGATKVTEDTAYGATRARQEGDILQNQTVPSYLEEGKQIANEAKVQTQDAATLGLEKLNMAKDSSSSYNALPTGALNSSTDHTSAKKEEIKGKASDSSAQARHALDDFEQAASAKTNSAVEQGKSDIDESKAKSAGYVQQVIETAQSYVHAGQAKLQGNTTQPTETTPITTRVMSTVQAAAGMALDTVDRSLNYAQSTISPSATSPATSSSQKPITQTVKDAVAPITNNVQNAGSTAISGVQQQIQYAKENTPGSIQEAKSQGQQTLASVNDKLAGATNPPTSTFEDETKINVREGLATSKPSEPSVTGGVQPYDDATKPAIGKPETSL